MTDKELIDGFLTGELDDAGLAQLEAELEKNSELLRELSENQTLDNVLRVLLGDGSADQQVTVSVLGVVRGQSLDDFKSRLMKDVKKVEEKKQKQVEARRIPTNKIPHVPAPTPANPIPIDAVRAAAGREPQRRGWGWGLAASIAACLAVGFLSWEFFAPKPAAVENTGAFLLSSTEGVEVHRGREVLEAGADMLLEPGDRIVVSESAKAGMGFHGDTSRVSLQGGAVVHLVRGGQSKRLELRAGSIGATVALQTEAPLVVETTLTEARVRSGEFTFLSGSDFSRLEVQKGTALLVRRSDGKSVRVNAEQYVVAAPRMDFEPMRRSDEDALAQGGPAIVAYLKEMKGKVFLFTKSPADRKEAVVGQPIRASHGLVTEGKDSRAFVEYLDQTRLEIAADTTVRTFAGDEKTPKHVNLDVGMLVADVVKQPKDRAMKLTTPHAEVEVLGTRFELTHDKGASRVQVEEGAVKFTQLKSNQSYVVASGYFALAASSHMFKPEITPGGLVYVDLDFHAGETAGDGHWTLDGRTVRQNKISEEQGDATPSPVSSHTYAADLKEGLLVEAAVEVTRVTSDMSSEKGAWGFGLVTKFGNRDVVLRSHQGTAGGSAIEFGGLNRAIPFEHGREGRYRLKLRIERPEGQPAILMGKLWQGSREPDGWMILDRQELTGNLTRVGLQTIRCAADFSSFRVRVLTENEQ